MSASESPKDRKIIGLDQDRIVVQDVDGKIQVLHVYDTDGNRVGYLIGTVSEKSGTIVEASAKDVNHRRMLVESYIKLLQRGDFAEVRASYLPNKKDATIDIKFWNSMGFVAHPDEKYLDDFNIPVIPMNRQLIH
ncbi:MAG TPA: hypothetical protein VI819_04020 [Patescibacteria group bacterium]|nr:hypothetical protein [Patescibacteria group bacterium]